MQQDYLYVYTIYQEGSFSKAAEKLYMSQPALSIAIRKLEANIGMPLFDRRQRPLRLTEAGTVFINALERMRGAEDDMDRALRDIRDLNSGTLRIGGSHFLNAFILPDALTAFSRQYPGIRIELVESGSGELCDMLKERRIDVTFSCNPILTEHFRRTWVFNDYVLLASSPKSRKAGLDAFRLTAQDVLNRRHLRADCPFLPIGRLAGRGFILLTEGNNLRDRALTILREGGVEPNIKLELSQLATAYHLAMADFGATFVSDRIVTHPDIPLDFYRLDSPQAERRFYAILPDREYVPFSVRTFISFLSERAGSKIAP